MQFLFQVDTSSAAVYVSLCDSYLGARPDTRVLPHSHRHSAYATASEVTVLDVVAEQRKVEAGPNALEAPMRRQATLVLDTNNNVISPLGAYLPTQSCVAHTHTT